MLKWDPFIILVCLANFLVAAVSAGCGTGSVNNPSNSGDGVQQTTGGVSDCQGDQCGPEGGDTTGGGGGGGEGDGSDGGDGDGSDGGDGDGDGGGDDDGDDDGDDGGDGGDGDGGGEDDVAPQNFEWTYYWIAYESDFAGAQDTVLYRMDGTELANVRDAFAEAVSIEGTGYLEDGRLINEEGPCEYGKYKVCFFEVDTDIFPYGVGSKDNALHPFRSVAADLSKVAFGTKIYVPVLDGIKMPDTVGAGFDLQEAGFEWDAGCVCFRHDGCVVVEDTDTDKNGYFLDFFALKEAYYNVLDENLLQSTGGWVENVDAYLNSPLCQ